MSKYTGSPAANFPQTSKNRTLDQLKAELADFSGGKKRDDIQSKAQDSLFQSIREFNDVAWNFNRVTEDITLSSPVSGTDAEYSLSADWRNPILAQLVDSTPQTRDKVTWIPWKNWAVMFPQQNTTGAIPLYYTARNIHAVGRVIIDPPPASSLTYPTMRLFYHKRIACPTTGTGVIDCPSEVEEAIFQRAVSLFISKVDTFREAREANVQAILRRQAVERDWRDYGEITQVGGIY